MTSTNPSTPAKSSAASRRLILAIAVFLAGFAALAAALFYFVAPDKSGSAVGGPFTLVNQDGATVTDKTFAGTPFLVFFGFTHCPDVCPTTLYQTSQMLEQLGPGGEKARVLFISVDPERDTSEKLKDYLSNFDKRIVGLTGSREQVDAVEKAYRVYARKVPTKDGNYTMDHSGLVYLMDARGRFVSSFDLNRPPAEAAKDFRRYL
jgi:protein SCO1/2